MKKHTPDDTCEYVSHHLQLFFRSSSQGQPFVLCVCPVSEPTSIHQFAVCGLGAERAEKGGVVPSVAAPQNQTPKDQHPSSTAAACQASRGGVGAVVFLTGAGTQSKKRNTEL